MFGKKLRMLGVMVAGTAIPYFWSEPQAYEQLKARANGLWTSANSSFSHAPTATDIGGTNPGTSSWTNSLAFWRSAPAELPPALSRTDLSQLLRFDWTPPLVIETWPRVTTVLSDYQLEGLRTPILTGVQLHDVAGSITFYFDKQHVLQRITLHGYTGDPQNLVQFVTSTFDLRPEPTLGAGLYCAKWNGRPSSALRLSHVPIVRASSPHAKIEVLLELNRQRGAMSHDFLRVLEQDRQLARW